MSYLMCEYGEGMHDEEYWVKFNAVIGEDQCFILKEDVIPFCEDEKGKYGLLKLEEIVSEEADRYVVDVNDVGDIRISRFHVKKEDVILDSR